MKDLMMTILIVGILTVAHFVICMREFPHQRLVDFVVHKLGASMAITVFLSDCRWSNLFIALFLGMFWLAWAFRYPLGNVLKANWIAFVQPKMADLLSRAAAQTASKQTAKVDTNEKTEDLVSETESPDLSEL